MVKKDTKDFRALSETKMKASEKRKAQPQGNYW